MTSCNQLTIWIIQMKSILVKNVVKPLHRKSFYKFTQKQHTKKNVQNVTLKRDTRKLWGNLENEIPELGPCAPDQIQESPWLMFNSFMFSSFGYWIKIYIYPLKLNLIVFVFPQLLKTRLIYYYGWFFRIVLEVVFHFFSMRLYSIFSSSITQHSLDESMA